MHFYNCDEATVHEIVYDSLLVCSSVCLYPKKRSTPLIRVLFVRIQYYTCLKTNWAREPVHPHLSCIRRACWRLPVAGESAERGFCRLDESKRQTAEDRRSGRYFLRHNSLCKKGQICANNPFCKDGNEQTRDVEAVARAEQQGP